MPWAQRFGCLVCPVGRRCVAEQMNIFSAGLVSLAREKFKGGDVTGMMWPGMLKCNANSAVCWHSRDFFLNFLCYFFQVFTSTSFFSSTAAWVVSQFVSKSRAWIELHRWYKNAWMLLKKACMFQASYPEFSLVRTGNPIIGIYWNAKLFPIAVASEGLLEPHTKNATTLLVTVTGWGSTPNSIRVYIYD